MELIRIDERLPDDALASEAVLHVRRHLRAAIRRRATTASRDLAHLFGFPRADGTSEDWTIAAAASDPIQAGAAAALQRRGGDRGVVTFGHDTEHVLECKRWLAARRIEDKDNTFATIKASDLATLLELCKARDIACAKGVDARGRDRFLPVLIQGPTGTGKELLAVAIHQLWTKTLRRLDAPFEAVQVGGMSSDMINDELFGHVSGAFTGAIKDRRGVLKQRTAAPCSSTRSETCRPMPRCVCSASCRRRPSPGSERTRNSSSRSGSSRRPGTTSTPTLPQASSAKTCSIVKLTAPSVIDRVRADAMAGGFAKVRERVVAALKESNDEKRASPIEMPAVPDVPPGKLTRAAWTRIAQDFPTQRAAVKATGYDPKTIAKYFRKHRIKDPWKKAGPA